MYFYVLKSQKKSVVNRVMIMFVPWISIVKQLIYVVLDFEIVKKNTEDTCT